MTREQAQRIEGPQTEVKLFSDGTRLLAVAITSGQLEGTGYSKSGNESDALKALVENVYHYRCRQVFKAQGWCCAKCGRRRALQGHHKKHRSQGRDDKISNIEALCQNCHRTKHE